ncbi:ArsR/SmtB family transcription factor [Candidatus Eisenbacteria bacterium]|uniref:ArsR/SmtB family transcription factor n=1 Tax=Eiseniibacteriota bacterium TaxID=2212470 RepID=A0ABV6YMF5_UNCEI
MREFLAAAQALSDRNRVRALLALADRELCVCQIIELLALSPSTVSKHMSILKQARLVEGRKDGRWVFYRLAGDDAPTDAREAIAWARGSLSRDRDILQDRKSLKTILKKMPAAAC